MDNFIAIDVETANGSRSSICSIGAVKVRDGVVVDYIDRALIKIDVESARKAGRSEERRVGKECDSMC